MPRDEKLFAPSVSVADPGFFFIPDPDPKIFPFRIRTFFAPDPGSYIKRGMKSKNELFSCFLWFQEEVSKVKK
jgi:hypothetical protein